MPAFTVFSGKRSNCNFLIREKTNQTRDNIQSFSARTSVVPKPMLPIELEKRSSPVGLKIPPFDQTGFKRSIFKNISNKIVQIYFVQNNMHENILFNNCLKHTYIFGKILSISHIIFYILLTMFLKNSKMRFSLTFAIGSKTFFKNTSLKPLTISQFNKRHMTYRLFQSALFGKFLQLIPETWTIRTLIKKLYKFIIYEHVFH